MPKRGQSGQCSTETWLQCLFPVDLILRILGKLGDLAVILREREQCENPTGRKQFFSVQSMSPCFSFSGLPFHCAVLLKNKTLLTLWV